MTELTDNATLVEAEAGAGEDALSDLYERYFDGVYDLAVHTLRDAEAAADVAQNTFVKAWAALRKGGTPANPKAWLYTIARNTALDECRRRQHFVRPAESDEGEGEPLDFMVVDESRFSDPQAALDDKELVQLVWGCASSLSPKDYTLLDMHLRQGLGPDELASALHVSKGNMYTMLSRLRDSLGEAVSLSLLVRRGRRDCEELDAILTTRGVELTPELRRAVQRHLRGCERCGDNQRRFVAPAEIFAGLAPVAALPAARAAVWQGIQARTAAGGATPRSSSSSIVVAVVAATVAVAAIVALVLGRGLAPRGASPLRDPDNFASTSHAIAQPSPEGIVVITWTARGDARGYATLWSHPAKDLPPALVDLDGAATGTSSPRLAPGVWYFHLRTQGLDGRWTSTVHIGPFIILASAATATPAEPGIPVTPSPSGTPQAGSSGSASAGSPPTALARPSGTTPLPVTPSLTVTQTPPGDANSPPSSVSSDIVPEPSATQTVPAPEASATAPPASTVAIPSPPTPAPAAVVPTPIPTPLPARATTTALPIVVAPSTSQCGLPGGLACIAAPPTCGPPGTANPCAPQLTNTPRPPSTVAPRPTNAPPGVAPGP